MSVRDVVRATAQRKILPLQAGYLADQPYARRMVALLRRSGGARDLDPDAWALLYGDVDESLVGRGDDPTAAEEALLATLALYAIHQQGRSQPMHVSGGATLGAAVRRLHARTDAESTVARLKAAGTSTSFSEACRHLRGLITQMRASDQPIPLDYGSLAVDLYQLQWPDGAATVRRRWGRDLHRQPSEKKNPAPSTTTDTDTTEEIS